jgi:hypothetical protein
MNYLQIQIDTSCEKRDYLMRQIRVRPNNIPSEKKSTEKMLQKV